MSSFLGGKIVRQSNKKQRDPGNGPHGYGNNVSKFNDAHRLESGRSYPQWLKENSSLKNLPGVYQGVLGQVQLQPSFGSENQLANGQRLANRWHQDDYANRFTDTERVHKLLTASCLSDEILATIWAHVNKTFPGRLTNREVCLALALIAIFQRLEYHGFPQNRTDQDPFSLVKSEKKPPLPKLYSESTKRDKSLANCSTRSKIGDQHFSKSLLVDFRDNEGSVEYGYLDASDRLSTQSRSSPGSSLKSVINVSTNLIDIGGPEFQELSYLAIVWLKFFEASKAVFKRSFDILNVENGRQSAIEALKSARGKEFSKNLSLCYPLVHNIRLKVDKLSDIELLPMPGKDQTCLFERAYLTRIDDLMTSINEYWAVLINLFHESGQTRLIELIMDGLNQKQQTVTKCTISELLDELNGMRRTRNCSICHTEFYLTTSSQLRQELSGDNPVENDEELLSEDSFHFYHPRCANFWLNQVDKSGLPFRNNGILSPDKPSPS